MWLKIAEKRVRNVSIFPLSGFLSLSPSLTVVRLRVYLSFSAIDEPRDALVFYLEFCEKQLSHTREMSNLASSIDMKKR